MASQLCVHIPVPVKSARIESTLRSMDHFRERCNSIVGGNDIDASLNASEQRSAKTFTDNWISSFPVRGL